MPLNVEKYAKKFRALRVHKQGETISPHKPCMLLAVVDVAERGDLAKNEIRVHDAPALADMTLIDSFRRYMKAAKPESPAKIANPLLRLKSEGFWHLSPRHGGATGFDKLPRNGGDDYRYLRDNVEFIHLDRDLHELLMDEGTRSTIRECLIDHWFPECREEMYAAVVAGREQFEYEQQLEDPSSPLTQEPQKEIRKPVFRRRVLHAYGYSCAATGLRFLELDVFPSLLDAAHIRPFADSHDDRTVNGIALQPTYHRAMDQFLIAPGPDLKWHVSNSLDDRINGHQELKKIDGESLIAPVEKRDLPDKHALQWRLERLHEMDRQRR